MLGMMESDDLSSVETDQCNGCFKSQTTSVSKAISSRHQTSCGSYSKMREGARTDTGASRDRTGVTQEEHLRFICAEDVKQQ